MSIPLPDGRTWIVDDHSQRELIATHALTRSKLVLYAFAEPELMSRQRCEARVREMNLVPTRTLQTVDDQTTIGPDAYDTRIWVALETGGKPGAPLAGHVFMFGGFLRKCLFAHFSSEVDTDRDEPVLSSRLATARMRIVGAVTVEPFDEPPRDRPSR